MIGAIQHSAKIMQPAIQASSGTQVAEASVAAPAAPELAQQVSEIIESRGDVAEAMLQAQVSILKEALNIRQSVVSGILQMLNGMQAFQNQVHPGRVAPNRIDLTV